jgi:thiosulfate/3-mercaptopyruvate sulfurtransferase
MTEIQDRGYATPDVLVSTDWVAKNLNNPKVRIVESNEDPLLYPMKHIPGAVEVDWTRDLNQPIVRDYLQRDGLEKLAGRIGLTPDMTVVFYGDKNNWWACYAYWIFRLFNHLDAKVMDGGRFKWEKEGRPMTADIPTVSPVKYAAPERDDKTHRAFRDQVLKHVGARKPLVDVRSPEEYTGTRLHMPDYPNEGALRGGHIPGALSIPWSRAINLEDGTFKSAEDLRKIYMEEKGLKHDDDVIAYCRIGERSSHTWFVLHYLLGFPKVRNYDGSWTEWGNLVGAPIEK